MAFAVKIRIVCRVTFSLLREHTAGIVQLCLQEACKAGRDELIHYFRSRMVVVEFPGHYRDLAGWRGDGV